MANKMVGSVDGLGFVNKQRNGNGANQTSGDDLVTNPVNYASIADMRTALAAQDAAYFTAARLDAMSSNDMVYAVRMRIDNGIATNGTI